MSSFNLGISSSFTAAVIGVEIDFNQLTGHNKSLLMVVATGTAVVVE